MMTEISEYEIIQLLIGFYFINMIMMTWLYLYTMYTQYKNAHDKWYDIIRENDIDRMRRLEEVKRE